MKTAFITGANKGIGWETARQLSVQGYYVYLGCRNNEAGEKAIALLKEQGLHDCAFISIDVTNEQSVRLAKEELASRISYLDVLINNAGIRGSVPQDASALPIAEIRRVFDTNFFGMINVTQEFLPLMKQAAHPRIVNVSSDLASLTRHQDSGWRYYNFKPAAYSPSKTALNAYTVMLAKELAGTTFKVNAVNPGHTATDFNNHSGHKTPEQAAQVIVKYAMLPDDGPTGKFFSEEGETPW
jgi:NAD(P)-dependent dehydrogenase (short-subunit alcohol dehydrogenase family)